MTSFAFAITGSAPRTSSLVAISFAPRCLPMGAITYQLVSGCCALVGGWRNYPAGDSAGAAFIDHRAVEVIGGSVCRMPNAFRCCGVVYLPLNEVVGLFQSSAKKSSLEDCLYLRGKGKLSASSSNPTGSISVTISSNRRKAANRTGFAKVPSYSNIWRSELKRASRSLAAQ
ncbi:MAG: hypothetical protein C5S49_00350 [Candidatus Methanogaster sp.]|nr:MAG: hypothetical protein C5S49_00350 [ANME-2 cluster archaeon]